MGCCENVQSSEEENIFSFFNRKLKENNFNFTIKTYKEIYESISKFSGNNFKRLCKKQNIRLNFIKIIKKEENHFIKYNKQKEEDIHKILYHIVILTMLLNSKINEFENDKINIEDINNNMCQNSLNSLKRELLELGYNLFNVDLFNDNNKKIIIYYLIKLFRLCFKDFHEVNNYISLKNYIEKIKSTIDLNNFIDEEEKYLFVKDNLLTFGEFFICNNYITFDEIISNIIIKISVMALNHWSEYMINNIQEIKENINKIIRDAIEKIIIQDDYNNIIENQINNNNIKIEGFNSDNINDEILNEDIKLIFESLYNIFKKIIIDIYSGKNIIINLGNQLISKNDENNEFNKIIIFILFYQCYIKDDEKLILCFLEYITDLYSNNEQIIINDNNNIYFDIALNSYYLMYKNEQLSKQYIALITQIFIKELETNNKNDQILIIQLIKIYQNKEKSNKINKLFFCLILNISRHYKVLLSSNIDGFNKILIKNIFSNLNEIIKSYFINNTRLINLNSIKEKNGLINTLNNNILSTNSETYNIYNYDNNINIIKISITNYEIITANFFHFNNIKNELLEKLEFYLYFHLFIINNMNIFVLINDFAKREKIYLNLFKIITHLEILLIKKSWNEDNVINEEKNEINENMDYKNDIISSFQIILKINELNDSNNKIQDCYLFYKSISKNIITLSELVNQKNIGKFKIDSFNLKIIYSVIFFIICQFINLINIPNSILKLNFELIESIKSLNEKCGDLLSKINISNFINSTEDQNYNYLKELFTKENTQNFNINDELFKKIMDIIYTKLFDKNSSLNIFFDNQIFNSNYFDNVNNSYNKSINISKISDNITDGKDNSLINQYKDDLNENNIEDISLHILDSKKKSNNTNDINNTNIFVKKDSNIKIPLENECDILKDKLLSNSFTIDDNQFQNIKI